MCRAFNSNGKSPILTMKSMPKWKIDDLPIIPSEYKYEVAKETKKQFAILKKLMNDKEVDAVINACDVRTRGRSNL